MTPVRSYHIKSYVYDDYTPCTVAPAVNAELKLILYNEHADDAVSRSDIRTLGTPQKFDEKNELLHGNSKFKELKS
jgi:hypothetical protein